MTDNIKNYNTILSLLTNFRFAEAIIALRQFVAVAGDVRLRDRLMELSNTYLYMLRYAVAGGEDAGRQNIIDDTKENLMELADLALIELNSASGTDLYSSTLRLNRVRRQNLPALISEYTSLLSSLSLADLAENDASELRERRETLKEDIFNSILTLRKGDPGIESVAQAFRSEAVDPDLKLLMTGAITISLSFYYSRSNFQLLLDLLDTSSDEALISRAMVGILLTIAAYPERISSDRKLMTRLSLWEDDKSRQSQVRAAVRAITGTRGTDKVSSKMKDEVIPELMKLSPDILKKMRESGSDLEGNMLDNNPEWEEMMEKTGLGDKIRELAEMQQEGADFMMVTFSNLKQFPFFNKAFNWLNPFDSRNPRLKLSPELRGMLDRLKAATAGVTDSDRYSMALALNMMPEAQRSMMYSQLSAQLDQLSEDALESLQTASTTFSAETVRAVRDLYRFFKLFRNRTGMRDPFLNAFPFTTMPVVGKMMGHAEEVAPLAEYYFKNGFYAEALPLLEFIADIHPDDASVWEKIGFCRQSAKDFPGALEAYRHSELLKTPGTWLLKKLAYVSKRLGDHSSAASYYRQALDSDPENPTLLISLGNTLLNLGKPEEAAPHFYHANYLSPSDPKIMRSIAWTELLKKNPEKSMDYYRRVMQIESAPADSLNAGHAALLSGDTSEALTLYHKAAEGNREDFFQAFAADIPTLEKLGIDPKRLRLIAEYLRMED